MLNLTKGTLFDHIPMDVIDAVNSLFIGLERHDKNKTILLRIKIQGIPVLCTLPYEHWTPYDNFI